MSAREFESCPGCCVQLPKIDRQTHRYLGASASCWTIFAALNNAGTPPLLPHAMNGLLIDAYAAQHPGTPSPQSIQSVAVHLLTLYGVLVRNIPPQDALWIRRRALGDQGRTSTEHFWWLTPPSFADTIAVADIVALPAAAARTQQVERYVESVWSVWSAMHRVVVASWYDRHVTQSAQKDG